MAKKSNIPDDININSDALVETLKDLSKSLKSLSEQMISEAKATGKYKDILFERMDIEKELTDIYKSVAKDTKVFNKSIEYTLSSFKSFKDIDKVASTLYTALDKGLLAGINVTRDQLFDFAKKLALEEKRLEIHKSSATEISKKLMMPMSKALQAMQKSSVGQFISEIINLPGILNDIESKLRKDIYNALKDGENPAKNIVGILSKGFSDIGKSLKAHPLLLSFGLLAGLIFVAYAVWKQFFQTTKAIRDETGLAAVDAKLLGERAREIAAETAKYGVTIEVAGKSASALVNEFQNMNMVTDQLIKGTALLSGAYGLAEADGAKLLRTLQSAGGLTDVQASNLAYTVGAMAKLKGVAPTKVLKDMAASSKEINLYFRGNVIQAGKAAIELNRIGLSLQKAANISRGLLEFDTSIEAELEASVLMGRQINLSMARYKAFRGDIAGATQEVLKQVGSIESFNRMNILQKEAIAKATGMEVDELANTLTQQAKLTKMTHSQRLEYDAIQERLGDLRGDNQDLLETAKKQLETEQLKARVTELLYKLTESLMPLFDALLSSLDGISKMVGWITEAFKILPGIFGDVGKQLNLIIILLLIFRTSIFKMIVIPFKWAVLGVMKLGAAIAGISFKAIFASISKIGTMLGGLGTTIGGMFSKLGTSIADIFRNKSISTWFQNLRKSAGGPGIFNKIGDSFKSMGTKIKDLSKDNKIFRWFRGLGKQTTDVAKSTTTLNTAAGKTKPALFSRLGKSIGAFFETLTKNAKGILAGAAALVLVAGAVWVFGQALLVFAKNDKLWESLGAAIVSMTAMVLAVRMISKMKKDILTGATALLLLSGALLAFGLAMLVMKDSDWKTILSASAAIFILSKSISNLGSRKNMESILKGAATMGFLSAGIASFGLALKLFEKIDLGTIAMVTASAVILSKTVSQFGTRKSLESILKGALGLGILSGALALFAEAIKPFVSIEWETLAKAGASLLALAGIAMLLGKISGDIIVGSIAVAILGASLIPLAYGLNLMKDVSWNTLAIAAVALVGFTLAVFGLGAILMSGVGAVLFAAGIVGILALAVAIAALGAAFMIFEKGSGGMNMLIDGFARLGESAGSLLLAAAGIGAIGVALMAFGAGQAASGIGSFIGNLFGGDQIKKIERLAEIGPNLHITVTSLKELNSALKTEIDFSIYDSLVDTIIKLSGINIQNLYGISLAFNTIKDSLSIIINEDTVSLLDRISETIAKLTNIDASNLFVLAKSIKEVAVSIAGLGAGNLIASISNLFGGDPTEKLRKLAEVGVPLSITSDSINKIKESLAQRIDFDSLNQTSDAIHKLGTAFIDFSKGNILTSLSGLFNSDPISKLERLSLIAPNLSIVSKSIVDLNSALNNLSIPKMENMDVIQSIGKITIDKNKTNTSKTEAEKSPFDGIINKLDDVVDAIENMKLYMDSKEVGKIISNTADRPGRG